MEEDLYVVVSKLVPCLRVGKIVAALKGSALSKWFFAKMAKPQFTAILIDLADAWADRMEREAK